MIILKRHDGRRFDITDADQERIREIALANGGDVMKAIAQQFEEKFGEPFDPPFNVWAQDGVSVLL